MHLDVVCILNKYSYNYAHSLSLTHTHDIMPAHIHARAHTHTHTHTHARTRTCTRAHTHTHTHTHMHAHAHTRTHTHTHKHKHAHTEFIVNDHNSPTFEQKEKNRNIPRKSVRKNNYSSRWDDEYRYRGFDERGYRNLSTERIQSYELKQWAIGGTGIVTGCVRDMTRSEHLLDREEHDLAFEVCVCVCVCLCTCVYSIKVYTCTCTCTVPQGRQELKEIESGLDSQIIERVSHVYMYKENHRPKHESVDPVTQ